MKAVMLNGIKWQLDPNGVFEGVSAERLFAACGYIPSFLEASDPRNAVDQLNANYQHGGGVRPIPGGKLIGNIWTYPEDPPFDPIASAWIHDDHVHIYPHAMVAIVQPDGTSIMTRID